ncbi:hypothetical protein [Niveibacterium sp. SC-1]|uniref:hypothetical protein n=1 Tax=Niveibacterium sp. SC-1 TaxID=3135646 RepID=UPI00311FCE3E
MLRIFNSSRADLPLADAVGMARSTEDLEALPPQQAVREAAEWLETLSQFKEADSATVLALLAQVDEATQPALRALREEYVAPRPLLPRSELWVRARHFWTQLAERYQELLRVVRSGAGLPEAAMAELCVRLIRASAGEQRWDSLHYGPFDQRHWSRVGDAYLAAQQQDLLATRVIIRPTRQTETSVANEYLRSVALATAALDELDEIQVEQAWRLLHYVLPSLRLETESAVDSIFWIHPASGRAPQRMVRPPSEGERPLYFSGSAARDALEALRAQLDEGATPAPLALQSDDDVDRLGPLLEHLIRHWSAEPPVRRHRRHKLHAQLQVVEGLEFVTDHLSGLIGLPVAAWEQRDVSLNGVGASAPLTEKHPLRIGSLVGMLSEDGNRWLVGMVRRMRREAQERALVGVEILSWHPLAARADDGARELRVLLLDPLTRGGTIRVAIPEGPMRRAAPLYLLGHNKAVKLLPQSLIERGADFEVRSYLLASDANNGQ